MLRKVNDEHYTLIRGTIVFDIKYDRARQEWKTKIGEGKLVSRSLNRLIRSLQRK